MASCMKFLCMILQARNKQYLIVFLLAFALLFFSSLTPSHFTAQGRQFPNAHARQLKKDEEIGVEMRSLIGSRPPKCEERCRNCGKCKAVQVPIAPSAAIKFLNEEILYGKNPTNRVEYSRGDDISSYKPMCWKCKCGDFFFNP